MSDVHARKRADARGIVTEGGADRATATIGTGRHRLRAVFKNPIGLAYGPGSVAWNPPGDTKTTRR